MHLHCQASIGASYSRMVFFECHTLKKSKMDPEEAGAEKVRMEGIECL